MTVVVSKGRLVEAAKTHPFADARPTTVRGARALQHDQLQINEAYGAIYSGQPWVFVVVNKRGRGMARVPLKSFRREPDGGRTPLPATGPNMHELPALLARPYPRGSRHSLINATMGNIDVYGKACWWKYRDGPGKPPVELWPLPWKHMGIETRADLGVTLFHYDGPAGRRTFLADDIVLFEWWSPNGAKGTSPLEPLRETLALETAGRGYAVSSFANGIRPAGALMTEEDLDNDEKDELRAEIQQLYGGTANAFRIALLDGGLKWETFAGTAAEAQTIEHRKLNREEVAAAYDMPPPAIGILDRATFSNITEQMKALYRETLGTPASMIEETIDAQLIWGEPAFVDTYVEFDFGELLKADLPQRAAAYRQMETTYSMNERRQLENRPPIGDLDDETNPANGVLYPLNMGVVLPNGTVLDGGATSPAGTLSQAVDDLVRERLEAALADLPDPAV